MAIKVLFSTFNLSDTGLNASDNARRKATLKTTGVATSATANFDDPSATFQTDGVTTSWRVQIITGGGNIQRDTNIASIPSETRITVGGGNFDTTESGLEYKVYLPPTDANILANQSDRGTGRLGYEELLQKADADAVTDLQSAIISVEQDGLAHQTITYDAV